MTAMAEHLIDGQVHLDDLMGFNMDPDAAMVDPALSMSVFGNLSGKTPEPFTVDPSTWSDSLSGFAPHSFQQSAAAEDPAESLTAASSPGEGAKDTRTRAKSSRTSSKSSVPSLSSGVSSPGVKQTRSKSTKTKETKGVKHTREPQEPQETKPAKAAKPAKKKQKTKKEVEESGGEDDSKRNKYLERNRIAASKCRQKKKVWVSDLETQKSDMEAMHSNLQREYAALVEQVTELKTELMGHAGCGDPNIDSWIETEAKRFVQRTADRQPPADSGRRQSSSASAGRRPSLSGMFKTTQL